MRSRQAATYVTGCVLIAAVVLIVVAIVVGLATL